MRFLAVVAMTILLVSSTVGAEDRSPVNVAFQLYEGCMAGYFMAAYIRPTRKDIQEFIESAHEQCLTWMVVWYKPITGNVMRITEWPDDSFNQLDARIKRSDYMMNLEIREILGVK